MGFGEANPTTRIDPKDLAKDNKKVAKVKGIIPDFCEGPSDP
jgi:hypothetical protein